MAAPLHLRSTRELGLVFLLLSSAPSLLPRGPLFQAGQRCGRAIGYGLGVFRGVAGPVHAVQPEQCNPRARRGLEVLAALGAIGLVLAVFYFHHWQDQVRD